MPLDVTQELTENYTTPCADANGHQIDGEVKSDGVQPSTITTQLSMIIIILIIEELGY